MAKRPKKSPNAPAILPGQCPDQECRGELQPVDERGNAIAATSDQDSHAWRCQRCGTDYPTRGDRGELARCPNDGTALRFDPDMTGETVGGLRLRGWNRCDHCGHFWLSRQGRPDDGGRADGRWRLSAGGRSLDAGGIRLRPEGNGSPQQVVQLMARVSRMPAFEAALERIASGDVGLEDAIRIAREALAIGDGVEEIDQ